MSSCSMELRSSMLVLVFSMCSYEQASAIAMLSGKPSTRAQQHRTQTRHLARLEPRRLHKDFLSGWKFDQLLTQRGNATQLTP